MKTQTENTPVHTSNGPEPGPTDNHESGYDVLATLACIGLVVVFAGVVATQGMDYVSAKLERYADVTSWVRR